MLTTPSASAEVVKSAAIARAPPASADLAFPNFIFSLLAKGGKVPRGTNGSLACEAPFPMAIVTLAVKFKGQQIQ
ncbi:hypothetical protein GCM10023067_00670 [Aminobacter aganoensis]